MWIHTITEKKIFSIDSYGPISKSFWEGIGMELECNNIDSYNYIRKYSRAIQTLYDINRERTKNITPDI